MTIFHVGAVQMESQDDLEANLVNARMLVREAAQRGAELVLLPENFAFMGTEEDKRSIAEELAGSGPIVSALRAMAAEAKVWVIGGGMPERSADPARPYNTSCAVAPTGEIASSYRKVHLFDVEVGDGASYRESASTSAGTSVDVLTARLGGEDVRVGQTVCYDLRFPALYQRLVDAGVQLLTVPAAFTLMTGKDHWHVLLRARAIETQSYVLAAGQWGAHPKGRRTYGKSCLVDPWGDVVAQASEGPGTVVGRVDLGYLAGVRRRLPCLAHRRPIE
jgi:predicted amidohydrolase